MFSINEKIKNKISQYVDDNKDWLINNIFNLIKQNTINKPPDGNENNGQDIIEKIFKELNLTIDRFSPDDVTDFKKKPYYLRGRNYKNRDNIVGFAGKGKKSTLIFNGHIDTVPSDKFNWEKSEPFNPQLIEKRIYGLGACDMKAGIILSIFALKTILDLGISIKGKVIIESVIDEEFGGANGSLACILRGYTGDFAIITEPSSMIISISNVCSKTLLIKVMGGEGLDYLGKNLNKINSIILTAKLLLAIKDYEDFLNSQKGEYSIFNEIKSPMNFLFSDIEAGKIGPDKILTTPGICTSRVYIMNYPDINNEKFDSMLFSFLNKYPEINEALKNNIIQIENYSRFIEGGEIDFNQEEIKNFINNINKNAKNFMGRELQLGACLGGTDFFAFTNYGNTPCIVLGPGGGNLHAADEFVELDDLLNLSKIFSGVIYDFCC